MVGIQVDIPVQNSLPEALLAPYFAFQEDHYVKVREPKVLESRSELRERLYRDGFWAEGVHYVSSGSARVGKCLFIDEALYDDLHLWEMCGLDIKEGEPVDLAALESYISL